MLALADRQLVSLGCSKLLADDEESGMGEGFEGTSSR
jgi:hypothetical protein